MRIMDEDDTLEEDDLKSEKFLIEAKLKVNYLSEWEPSGVVTETSRNQRRKKSISSQKKFLEQLKNAGSMTEACIEPGWRVNDIILASKVLQKEFESNKNLIYSDEAEMRRVFGLVYDVLRCKKKFHVNKSSIYRKKKKIKINNLHLTHAKNLISR